MSLFIFLTVIQALVAAALVGVVLMQRSEGGGLGIGGNPSGALGARGAADFLSRSTKWLAIAFVSLSIALAAVAVDTTSGDTITSTLERDVGGPDTSGVLGGPPSSDGAASPDDLLAEPGTEEAPAPAENEDPLAE